MQTALVLRHVAFEDLGTLEPVLLARGYQIRYLEMGLDQLGSYDPLAPDLVVVLGGPIGVYERTEYPFLNDEVAWIRARLDARKPVIGLCLGAQLMAAASGASVHAGGNGKEIGWSTLLPTAEAKAFPFMQFLEIPVLHWHGDTFDLPAGAVLLAGSSQYAHQIYAIGSHAIGFQCHPEVTKSGLERWYIGHACEIAHTPGVTVPGLRAQAEAHAAALEQRAAQLWPLLLDRLA